MANGSMADGSEPRRFCHVSEADRPKPERFRAARFLEAPSNMASRIISERTFDFACRIVKLCERMWKGGPASRKIADQLFDSGTSIGANSAESQGGQTK